MAATARHARSLAVSDQQRLQRRLDGHRARTGASATFLCGVQHKKLKVILQSPSALGVTDKMLQTAARALRQGKAASRLPSAIDRGSEAIIAIRTRLGGQPAVLCFNFPATDSEELGALVERALGANRAQGLEEATRSVAVAAPAALPKRALPAPGPRTLVRQVEADVPESADKTDKRSVQLEDEAVPETTATFADNLTLVQSQGAALSALAGVLDYQEFREALGALADSFARGWSAQRVSVGLTEPKRVRVAAMSGSADWQSQSALATDIAEAMSETYLANCALTLPPNDNEPPPRAHQALSRQLKEVALLSVPLVDKGNVIGVVLFEREYAFDNSEIERIEQTVALLGPVLALKRSDSLGSRALLAKLIRRPLAALFGGRNLTKKLLAVTTAMVVLGAALLPGTFRVSADARIEPTVQRAVVANFDSFLRDVRYRAGDMVREGDVLATLDTQDLELQKIRWEGERDKLIKEYRALLAQRDRSNLRVLEAQRDQAQAQLDLVEAQLERATLRAPMDGVVVSGDLSQMRGSPVTRGDLLFEVAALEAFRLSLLVDESDIGWIEIGDTGRLRLRSHPDDIFSFTVTSITPVSEPGGGANRFRVEAQPDALPETLRPGMEGVAKIEVGERTYGWIWGHSLYHWLKMQLWKRGL